MDLDKQAVQDVKDLFDIKYDTGEDNLTSTEGMPANFSDLEGEVSSVISNLDEKGEVLEEAPEESKEIEEKELETIDDLIADSVEEAKALTIAQDAQEDKKVEEETLEEDFDSIVIEEGVIDNVVVHDEVLSPIKIEDIYRETQTEKPFEIVDMPRKESKEITDKDLESIEVVVAKVGEVNANNDILAEDVKKQLSEVVSDPNATISHGYPDISKFETSPVVLKDEDIEIIPCKDSEGCIKGEIKMKDVVGVSWDRKGNPNITGGEILWNIESPSELYDEFYSIKADKINTFSGGVQLDFARLYQDLYSTSVDTSTEVLDSDILLNKLDLVVQGINRVAMIQVQVNQQQFVWKRFVELLRGALARVQYLKPVLKQDGLQLEHMGDIEFYSERLNALKESAHDCMKNLERAFESVSRKVTVMLTVQTKHTTRMSPDAYSNSGQQTYQVPPSAPEESVAEVSLPINTTTSEDMGSYDSFEIGVEVKSGKPKAGEIEWSDAW